MQAQGKKDVEDWNPALYHNFYKERRQAFDDLIKFLTVTEKLKILDLGCGSGNLSKDLHDLFPESSVLGIDSSSSMLSEASKLTSPRLNFKLHSISEIDKLDGTFDLIFGNSSLHWLPDHQSLFPKIFTKLNSGGQIAFQFPTNHTQEFYSIMRDVAAEPELNEELQGWKLRWPILELEEYATLLYKNGFKEIHVIEKVYPHVLPSADAVVAWILGTGMRAYLDRLKSDASVTKFISSFSNRVRSRYPSGEVFFPFRRVFVFGKK
eukprot:TRINITY_DN5125_c0_g1_i4.p1 TRINITY_DN5125_c0_g1~~TRINITY_DN5125_c0_g1_i4.p1  ORF type:complete len:265 (+),score=44.92 TRINITY_DN5125_c0_g1_i4:45-839(+)